MIGVTPKTKSLPSFMIRLEIVSTCYLIEATVLAVEAVGALIVETVVPAPSYHI